MANDRQDRPLADRVLPELLVQAIDTGDRCFVETDDDVSFPQSSGGRRASGLDRNHQQSLLDRQIVKADNAPVQLHILSADADVTAPYPAVLDQPSRHILGGINGNGKAEALR